MKRAANKIILWLVGIFYGTRVRKRLEEKLAILQLRREFAIMGFDLREFTDEEIKEGKRRMAEVARKAAFSSKELQEAAIQMSKIPTG